MSLGFDVSNFTNPLTELQLTQLKQSHSFAVIGIQDGVKARAFVDQLAPFRQEFYIDLPMRDWSIFPPGARAFIDIERGCYTRRHDVDTDLNLLERSGFRPGIYCNQESLKVLDAPPDPAWSRYPLWYAAYPLDGHVPLLREFKPFNGWTRPVHWQYSSKGIYGINCDLNVSFEPDPVPPEPIPVPSVMALGTPDAGIELRPHQVVVWVGGVEVLSIGDTDGVFHGQLAKNMGKMDGSPVDVWRWLRRFDIPISEEPGHFDAYWGAKGD